MTKTSRKPPTPATLKALFAKSGNQCAFDGCLSSLVDERDLFVGQVCHILPVGSNDKRHDKRATDEELRSRENLILLCYPHHCTIDEFSDEYSADALRAMRMRHESLMTIPFSPSDSVLDEAALSVVDEDWIPYLGETIELLNQELQEAIAQQWMNRVSRYTCSVLDAQLILLSVCHSQTFSNRTDRIRVKSAFLKWRQYREEAARAAVESHGGTLAPLEYSMEYAEITKIKIVELESLVEES